MARRQNPSGYGNDAYGAGSPSGAADRYDRRPGDYRQASPYDQQPYGRSDSPYDQRSYGRQDSPYGARGQAGGRPSRTPRAAQGPSAYPVGSGRAYESSRPPRTAGVQPVSGREYRQRSGGPGRQGPSMDRRKFLAVAGGAVAAVGVLGFVGVNWFTHRAVACTVNGAAAEAPLGSTAEDIIKRGLAAPVAGNLVAIAGEGEVPQILTEGGGSPYALSVNGAPVDPASYRLAEGDVLEFSNGADVTEEVVAQTAEIPCGIQIPADHYYLNTVGYVKQWGRNGISSVETGTISGRTIDRGIVQEPQDLIIDRSTINPADGRRLVALTIDDGPSPTYTPQYLDIFAHYGVKATFFNLGSTLVDGGAEYAALCKRCIDEGHQMASHTYWHGDPLPTLSDEARNTELTDTFNAIANATGTVTKVMRPPYGEFKGINYLRYLQAGGDLAYSAYWNVDSLDWDVATKTGVDDGAAQIIANCTNGLASNPDAYNGAVILIHDGGGDRTRDVAALPGLIEAYQAQGFEFVTMNELLASAQEGFPEWVYSGTGARPEGAIVPDASVEVTYVEY